MCIAAESAITSPNWAIMTAQNTKLPPNNRETSSSELATNAATTAVISRPLVIQMYTRDMASMKVLTNSDSEGAY